MTLIKRIIILVQEKVQRASIRPPTRGLVASTYHEPTWELTKQLVEVVKEDQYQDLP